MRKLTTEKRDAILAVLFEGNSFNSVVRIVGVSKVTVPQVQCSANLPPARRGMGL